MPIPTGICSLINIAQDRLVGLNSNLDETPIIADGTYTDWLISRLGENYMITNVNTHTSAYTGPNSHIDDTVVGSTASPPQVFGITEIEGFLFSIYTIDTKLYWSLNEEGVVKLVEEESPVWIIRLKDDE